MSGSRGYDNRRRREAAEATHHRIIEAAGSCFQDRGYAATTLAAIADRAHVSVETIKKTIGTKRSLLRRWFDRQVAGSEGVPVIDQSWLSELSSIPDVTDRTERAAAAVTATMGRAAAAVSVMTAAAHADPEIARMWATERAARYADVAAIVPLVLGDTADGGSPDLIDAIYAVTEAHIYLVLVEERGWTSEHYQAWLSDTLLALALSASLSQNNRPPMKE